MRSDGSGGPSEEAGDGAKPRLTRSPVYGRSGAVLPWLLLLVCCGDERTARLDVLLQTDFRPGVDFVEVRTQLLDEVVDEASLRVMDPTLSYLSARDVARFGALPGAARRRARVSLFDADGRLVGTRTAGFPHDRDRQQRMTVCAACEDFACPLGQTCHCGLTPVCVPDDCEGDDCGGTGCGTDLDCGSSPVACASMVCRERACLRAPDDSVCGAMEVCDVSSGCVAVTPPNDGGVDAGSPDGGPVVPPRQVSPPSASVVTSQRPTLRWELATGSDGALVELCRDRAMSSGCLEPIAASGDRVRPPPLAVGAWFWRVRGRAAGAAGEDVSHVWQFWVGWRSADGDVDTSWGSVTDLDGDGFADVVVGAPLTDVSGRLAAGTASVHLGAPSGLSTAPMVVIAGPDDGGYSGWSVASAGDVNGDGYGDLIVGAVRANPGGHMHAGAASVFFGGPTGPAPTPALVIEGDTPMGELGASVAGAGDVDGDGFADVLVGAIGGGAGSVRLYRGSASGLVMVPALVLEGVGNVRLGVSVASAGDVNGDGYADVVLGADRASPGGRERAGTASVYLGSSSGLAATPSVVIEGRAPSDALGATVAGVGDVNGDGYADIIASAYFASPGGLFEAGEVSVHLGSPSGVSSTPALVLTGAATGDRFGRSIASGDLNGDGYSDVLVGAPFAGVGGTVSVFLGSPAGLSAVPALVLTGAAAGERFGRSVASGDANGDGYADVMVGGYFASPGGRVNAGATSFYVGSPAGLSMTPAIVLEGPTAGGHFGRALAFRRPAVDPSGLRRRPGSDSTFAHARWLFDVRRRSGG